MINAQFQLHVTFKNILIHFYSLRHLFRNEFFHHRLEIADMVIIISTFVMTLVFELIVINQHVKFGK